MTNDKKPYKVVSKFNDNLIAVNGPSTIMVDPEDVEIYPDTPKVRKLLKEMRSIEKKLEKEWLLFRKDL
jgi:hypothetical protein